MVVFIRTSFVLICHKFLLLEPLYTVCFDAKNARCWKYSSGDTHTHFPPVSTFHPNRNAVATGLSFISTLGIRSERSLPILMEIDKNNQITLPKGRIGFSPLDVVDRDEPKKQIRSAYELTKAIISPDQRYNDCVLLHLTVPYQISDFFYSFSQNCSFESSSTQFSWTLHLC